MTAAQAEPASKPRRARNQGRRPDIETDLAEKYHVTFTYLPAVATSEFDIDRSLHNQARFEPLDEHTVEQYQEGVVRGDPFPAVIAYRPGRGANAKLVIIDGNHRLVAHDRAKAKIDVYEVDRSTRPQTVALLTFACNTRHGRPTSEEERLAHALYLIDNGASTDAAASAVNVPLRLVRKAAAKANADKRADEVGVDRREWDALGASARSRLLNISTDEGFHGAVHLAYAAQLDSNEIFDLTALLNTSKSAAKQRAIIKAETARYSDRIQDAASGVLNRKSDRRAMTPKSRVGMILGQVLALPEDLDGIARSFADSERADAAQRLREASSRLDKLANTIDPDPQ